MHSKKYDEIISSMPAGLDRKVMRILVNHIGRKAAISRRDLVHAVYGVPAVDISTSSEDRQIRSVIAGLQGRFPILSDSGAGGYYLCGSREEGDEYIAEIISRARELENKAKNIGQLIAREYGISQQMGLF